MPSPENSSQITPPKAQNIAKRGASARIVVIAGAESVQHLTDRFKEAGCKVLAGFESAAQALAEAGHHQPELAVADIELCGRDTDFAALESLAEILMIPALFITRFDDEPLLEKAARIKPCGFVSSRAGASEIGSRVNLCLKKAAPDTTAQREILHPLINTLSGGAFSTDLEGRLTYASKAAADLLGWVPEKALGMVVFDLIDPADRDVALRGFAKLKEGLPGPTVMVRMQHKKGGRLLCRITMHPLLEKGGVKGGVGVLEDVTHQYLAEVKLKESEERYRRLYETAPVGLVHLGLDGRYIMANNRMHEMLGYEPGELNGVDWGDISHPDEVDAMLEKDELLFTDKLPYYSHKKRYFTKKGDIIWGRATVTLARDAKGEPDYFLAAVEDISERRRAEQDLARSESSYRDLVENANIAILRLDEKGRITFLNRAGQELFGYSEDELLGRLLTETDLLGGETDTEELRKFSRKLLADPDNYHHVEAEGVGRDGRKLWISWNDKAMYNQDGELAGFLCLGSDITHRKKAEQAKMELMNQLQHAQKMESIGTLASGIAHDFNNILQTISGYAHLLKLKLNQAGGRHLAQYLEAIDHTSQRGSFMVERLLTLGRKGGATDQVSDLNREVDQCVSMLKRILPRKVSFKTDLTKGPAMARAAAGQVEQVMINLANNACDAMPEGGEISISTETVSLDHEFPPGAATLKPGPYFRISVADSGIGMDPATRERIFDPFFTTKSRTGGTGLGLSMVYGIINSLDGAINCVSQPKEGSEFTIHLPLTDARQPTAKPEEKGDAANLLGGETLLLVDDEPAILDTMSDSLLDYGYQVLTASSGEEALKLLQAEPGGVDLVILDLDMPGMGGRKALDRIMALDSGIKVIIVSGYAEPEMIRGCLGAGASGFLPKPFRLTGVMKLARQVLDE